MAPASAIGCTSFSVMKHFIFYLSLLLPLLLGAQNTWTKKYDFSMTDWPWSQVEVSDGYVIMMACQYVEGAPIPPVLIKVDKQGELVWTCNPEPVVYFSDSPITPHRCVLAPDSTLLVCGRIATSDTTAAVFVIKVSQQGEIIWNKLYKESYRYYEYYWTEQIATWPNGDFVVTGVYYRYDDTPNSMFLLKCNAGGDLLDDIKLNYPPVLYAGYEGGDSGNPVILPDGDIFFCFFARWNTRYHPILNRLDSNLKLKWQKEATVMGRSYELVMASDGNILMYVEGGYNNYPWGADPIVQKLTPDGDSLWTYSPPGINSQLCHDMSVLTNGNIVFTGTPDYFEWLRCISADGHYLWHRKFRSPVDKPNDRMRFQKVMGTSDGGMLIAGYYRHAGTGGNYDAILLKLDGNGCLMPDCDVEFYLTDTKEPGGGSLERPPYFLLRTNMPRPGMPIEVRLGEGFGEGRLRLFSAAGRLASEQKVLENSQAEVPTRSLSPGIYVLVLEGRGGALQTERVLVTF